MNSYIDLGKYLAFAIPLALTNIVSSAQNLFNIFLAKTVNADAVAAMVYVNRVYFVYGCFLVSINAAISMRMNRLERGERDSLLLKETVKCSFVLVIPCAVICFVVFYLFAPTLAMQAGGGAVVRDFERYLKLMAMAYVTITLLNPFYSYLISRKQSAAIFKGLFFSVMAGVGTSLALLNWFTTSLWPIAAGSVVTQVIYSVHLMLTSYYVWPSSTIRASFDDRVVLLKGIFSDSANNYVGMIVGCLADYLVFAIFINDPPLALFLAIFVTVSLAGQSVCLGFASAAAVEVGRSLKGRRLETQGIARSYMVIALVLGIVFSVLSVFYVRALVDSATAVSVSLLCGLIVLFSTTSTFINRAVVRAFGETRFIRNTAVVFSVFIRIPFSLMVCFMVEPSSGRIIGLFSGYAAISFLGCLVNVLKASSLIGPKQAVFNNFR
ncbi:MATE family efflux transporter [Pseudomonas syringae]|nr:MATE family efflux transporter [Pseudomonas syringae]